MNRFKWLLGTVVIFGVMGVGVWLLWLRVTAINSVFLTTTSPAQTYTVRISGRKERPRVPFVMNTSWFSVNKGSEDFLQNEYLHSGDWLDPSFDILYPEHNWPSENVLHFFRGEYFKGGEARRVVVKNSSSQAMKYVLVVSLDTHLLFDVQPNSQIELKVPPGRADTAYISVEGQYSDGRALKRIGQNFGVTKQQTGTCYVDVSDGGVKFDSAGWEKYTPQ